MQHVPRTLNETYEAEPAAASAARSAVAGLAVAHGATDEQVDGIRLAVSEAVTNAVLHAYRGRPGTIRVTAEVDSGELRVVVADEGAGMTPRADRPGMGLGLGLISEIADRFVVRPRAAGGTEVRISFRLASDGRVRRAAQARMPGRSMTLRPATA